MAREEKEEMFLNRFVYLLVGFSLVAAYMAQDELTSLFFESEEETVVLPQRYHADDDSYSAYRHIVSQLKNYFVGEADRLGAEAPFAYDPGSDEFLEELPMGKKILWETFSEKEKKELPDETLSSSAQMTAGAVAPDFDLIEESELLLSRSSLASTALSKAEASALGLYGVFDDLVDIGISDEEELNLFSIADPVDAAVGQEPLAAASYPWWEGVDPSSGALPGASGVPLGVLPTGSSSPSGSYSPISSFDPFVGTNSPESGGGGGDDGGAGLFSIGDGSNSSTTLAPASAFESVEFNAEVPEPMTYLTLGTFLMIAVVLNRKKRARPDR